MPSVIITSTKALPVGAVLKETGLRDEQASLLAERNYRGYPWAVLVVMILLASHGQESRLDGLVFPPGKGAK
jgi:hypothetical protein